SGASAPLLVRWWQAFLSDCHLLHLPKASPFAGVKRSRDSSRTRPVGPTAGGRRFEGPENPAPLSRGVRTQTPRDRSAVTRHRLSAVVTTLGCRTVRLRSQRFGGRGLPP